jgi:hypothetical protein
MRTALLLAILSLCGALGDVSLAKGMKQVGALPTLRPGALLVLGSKMARNGAVRLGLLFMITAFLTFVVLLSWADLSFIGSSPLESKYSSNPSPKISSGTPRHHCAGSVIGQDAPATLDAGSDPVGPANAVRTRLAASGYTGGPSV